MVELQTQPASSAPSVSARKNKHIYSQPSATTTAPMARPPLHRLVSQQLQPKLDTFVSPVNENGSFEFDRVIKSGYLQKRTKTKTWRTIFLVLRPNTLSIYKSEKEDKLRYQVFLSELTAVTFLKDPKNKRQNVFGIFSPSRNYHLQAPSAADAHEWVERIRREARIEEEEEEMFLASPAVRKPPHHGVFAGASLSRWTPMAGAASSSRLPECEHERERLASSSPEPQIPTPRRPVQKKTQNSYSYSGVESSGLSGNEFSWSDYSDGDAHIPALGVSFESLSGLSPPLFSTSPEAMSTLAATAAAAAPTGAPGPGSGAGTRNLSLTGSIGMGGLEKDPDRVMWQGWLWFLRSKGGVRQWKNSWAVLRPRNLILYKDESEYAAQFIVALASIVNVVERDPMSRSKQHCLEIITEEKSYRFATRDEETLLQCLGAFKSLLSKRRELENRAAAAAVAAAAVTAAPADVVIVEPPSSPPPLAAAPGQPF